MDFYNLGQHVLGGGQHTAAAPEEGDRPVALGCNPHIVDHLPYVELDHKKVFGMPGCP